MQAPGPSPAVSAPAVRQLSVASRVTLFSALDTTARWAPSGEGQMPSGRAGTGMARSISRLATSMTRRRGDTWVATARWEAPMAMTRTGPPPTEMEPAAERVPASKRETVPEK